MKITAQAGSEVHEITVTRVDGKLIVTVDGVEHGVDARKLEGDFYSLIVDGKSYEVSVEAEGSSYFVRHGATEQAVTLTVPGRKARDLHAGGDGPARVVSVMPGKIVRVLVGRGDAVQRDQGLVVVEAMKMENEIVAPRDGRVQSIEVQPGTAVEAGETLVVIE